MTKGALGKDSILSWLSSLSPTQNVLFPGWSHSASVLILDTESGSDGLLRALLSSGRARQTLIDLYDDTSSVSGHNYAISYSLKSPVSTIEP